MFVYWGIMILVAVAVAIASAYSSSNVIYGTLEVDPRGFNNSTHMIDMNSMVNVRISDVPITKAF